MTQDLASVRDLAKSEQVCTVLARVALHEGETSHWLVTGEGHLAVTVLTHKHQAPITAILPGGGDNSLGVWWVPSIGTEVAVGFDDGDYEADAYVLAIYGNKPPQNLGEDDVRVYGTTIHLMSAPGVALKPAPTITDIENLVAYLKKQFDSLTGHTHAVVGGATTTIVESSGATGSSHVPDPQGSGVVRFGDE